MTDKRPTLTLKPKAKAANSSAGRKPGQGQGKQQSKPGAAQRGGRDAQQRPASERDLAGARAASKVTSQAVAPVGQAEPRHAEPDVARPRLRQSHEVKAP